MRSEAGIRNRTHPVRVRTDNDGLIASLAVPLLAVVAFVASTPAGPNWLDDDQRRRAVQLVSAFENSTTEVQYGYAEDLFDDPDGLYALIERTNDAIGTLAEVGERAWLDGFFDVRIDDLTNPADADTAEDWRQSTDRVECMRRIAASGNYDLAGPLTFSVYGDEFTIE